MRRTVDCMEQAKGEFKAARDLFATSNHAWCCFTCQQAAEKSLKAILEHFGSPTVGHNLIALATEVSGFTQIPKEVDVACRTLNRYYIPIRYPNAFPSGAPIHMFDENDAREALQHIEKVMGLARKVTGII